MRKLYYLLFSILIFLQFKVSGFDNPDSFVKIPVGARAFGMSGAFTAIADDPTATYWNPAGLAYQKGRYLAFMHTNKFDLDILHDYLAYTHVLPQGTIGISATRLGVDGIQTTDDTGNLLDTTNDEELYWTFSFGKQIFKRTKFGFNIKRISQSLATEQSSGWSSDIGFLHELSPRFRLGLMLADFLPTEIKWSTDHKDRIPLTARGAFLYHNPKDEFMFSVEIEKTLKRDYIYKVGTEYKINDLSKIRAGVKNNSFSGGFSLNYFNWTFDYGYESSKLEGTHLLSAVVKLSKIRKAHDKRSEQQDIDRKYRTIEEHKRIIPRRQTEKNPELEVENILKNYRPNAKKKIEEKSKKRSVDAETHYKLANTFMLEKIYSKAILEYKEAIKIDPEFKQAHYNLAAVYQSLDMPDKAIFEYQRALGIDDTDLNSLLALANIYLEKGNKAKASVLYNRIILLAPESLSSEIAKEKLKEL